MNKWIKRVLLLLQIGGGFTGVSITVQTLMRVEPTVGVVVISLIFGAIFGFGMVAGLALVENERLGIVLSQVYQAVQIPVVSSPIIVYRLCSGLVVNLFYQQGGNFGGNLRLGTEYGFYLFVKAPWGIGVNLAALLLLVYLTRCQRKRVEPSDAADLQTDLEPWPNFELVEVIFG
jgi:hypothetical protein